LSLRGKRKRLKRNGSGGRSDEKTDNKGVSVNGTEENTEE